MRHTEFEDLERWLLARAKQKKEKIRWGNPANTMAKHKLNEELRKGR